VSSPAGPPSPPRHPDYRFSLANERTLLAWLRTALALVAGGVAMTQFVPDLGFPAGGPVVSVGLLLAGLGTALAGYRRYVRNEAAIAADQPLPAGPAAWVTGLVAALVVALLVLVVVEIVRG
jgi:putative membrane protein